MLNLSSSLVKSMLFTGLAVVSVGCYAQNVEQIAQPTTPVPVVPSAAPTIDQPTQAFESIPAALSIEAPQTGSCAMRVYTAQSVVGVTTKSGFAKFALGTLLPAVAGSVAGSASGSAVASRQLATQMAVSANHDLANRASDVPLAIASKFAPMGQVASINKLMSSSVGKLDSAPAVFDEGTVPKNGLEAAPFGLTDSKCVRFLTIDSITFEHSKDFKKRNAVVILSNLVEYVGGKKKPSIRVSNLSRSPITPFDVQQEVASPELQAELDKAFDSAIMQLIDRYEKKKR